MSLDNIIAIITNLSHCIKVQTHWVFIRLLKAFSLGKQEDI